MGRRLRSAVMVGVARLRARLLQASRARLLRATLDRWIQLQEAELEEFANRSESEQMRGSLAAFEAVCDYLDTGREPMFLTLR
jgi:hypothetical protein